MVLSRMKKGKCFQFVTFTFALPIDNMTKQQQSRINEIASEKGIPILQPLLWNQACELAIAYHASFKKPSRAKGHTELYKGMVEIWLKEVHPGWTFSAVDGRSMNTIIDKMRLYVADPRNNLIVPLDKTITEYNMNFFRHFCKKLPEFYKNQTLNVLASKFDSIIDDIKTQNGKKRIVQRPAEHLSKFAQ